MSDAMRSSHAPKACITGEACITHEVRITFRKERITQKNLICHLTNQVFLLVTRTGIEPMLPP